MARLNEIVRRLLRRRQRQANVLRQNWGGALRDYREDYTAMELQRQAVNWRVGSS